MQRTILAFATSFIFSFLVILLLVGCEIGTMPGGTSGKGNDVDDVDCEGPLGPAQDPAGLESCCPQTAGLPGGSHCLSKDTVPGELNEFLATCESGATCVPDKFIATGGIFTPKECSSIGGAAGVCLSVCVPSVAEFAALLPLDICDEGEKCAPCINPLDDTNTHACEIKATCESNPFDDIDDDDPTPATCPHVGAPLLDPSSFPACNQCGGNASCIPNNLVPADFKSRLAACDVNSMCVPNEFVETAGNFIPPTCESIAGAEGRCLSTCLPEVASQADLLPQATCGTTEKCVPCFDPISGMDTGACGISCDPGPVQPPTVLPTCCDGVGTCIPAEAAGENADSLGEDVCPEDQGFLCAPNVLIEPGFVAQSCTTSGLFGGGEPGACLPECLPDVDTILVGQGDCSDGYKCAPCQGPFGGDTGACDFLQP